ARATVSPEKLPFPILFFIGLTLLPEIRFARHDSNLSFRLLIPDTNRPSLVILRAMSARELSKRVMTPQAAAPRTRADREFSLSVLCWPFYAAVNEQKERDDRGGNRELPGAGAGRPLPRLLRV